MIVIIVFIVLAAVLTIVNYNWETFVVQATGALNTEKLFYPRRIFAYEQGKPTGEALFVSHKAYTNLVMCKQYLKLHVSITSFDETLVILKQIDFYVICVCFTYL